MRRPPVCSRGRQVAIFAGTLGLIVAIGVLAVQDFKADTLDLKQDCIDRWGAENFSHIRAEYDLHCVHENGTIYPKEHRTPDVISWRILLVGVVMFITAIAFGRDADGDRP